ncbi:hypothetical protein VB779_15955 [Haloarculaceae archaeon H-GB11]|nr:hypothetical protein [Haloarculaceae archaeon H-GB11]
MDVTNTGNETLTNIGAEMFADDPISVSDSEGFINRLEPGETETVKFTVSAAGSATPKSYPVSVDFQYDDSDGDTLLSDTYRLPVTVTEREGGSGNLPIIVGLVAILVVGVGGYWYYSRQ